MGNLLVLTDGGRWLWQALVQTALQLLCLAAPFGLIAVLLARLERWVQRPLAARFGWRSVLWTGWLGTPVHELSHAALCVLFRHRIDRMSLFKLDHQAGRLGYVKHSYNRKNPYQVVGNFFIGLAPLAGGTLVLYGLLWLCYPSAARQAYATEPFNQAIAGGQLFDALGQLARLALNVLQHVVSFRHVATLKLWVFLYLTLCVGSHMAPSAGDYRGALWGGLLLVGMLLMFNLVHVACGGEPAGPLSAATLVFGPALALFSLSALLSGLAAGLVVAATKLIALVFGKK